MSRGLMLVVSGPSGAGKSTVLKRLLADIPQCRFSVSSTTRAPRPGEVSGVDYDFLTEAEFLAAVEGGKFLEHARVHACYYGTPRERVDAMRESGYDVVLDIDVQGADQVRAQCPDAVFVFIAPPSLEDLERRLQRRATETPERLQLRLQQARKELERVSDYQYLIYNREDEVEATLEQLKAVRLAEKCRTSRQLLPEVVATGGKEV